MEEMKEIKGTVFFRTAHCSPQGCLEIKGTEEDIKDLLQILADSLDCDCCNPVFKGQTRAENIYPLLSNGERFE